MHGYGRLITGNDLVTTLRFSPFFQILVDEDVRTGTGQGERGQLIALPTKKNPRARKLKKSTHALRNNRLDIFHNVLWFKFFIHQKILKNIYILAGLFAPLDD
jgi:hypothetical protein